MEHTMPIYLSKKQYEYLADEAHKRKMKGDTKASMSGLIRELIDKKMKTSK